MALKYYRWVELVIGDARSLFSDLSTISINIIDDRPDTICVITKDNQYDPILEDWLQQSLIEHNLDYLPFEFM